MKSRLVSEAGGQRTFVVVRDPGEEAFAALTAFAIDQGVDSASLTAIGAFERAIVGWFDPNAKTYRKTNNAKFRAPSAMWRWAMTASPASTFIRCWD